MKIYTNDLVKGHSDFKVKCLTFSLNSIYLINDINMLYTEYIG